MVSVFALTLVLSGSAVAAVIALVAEPGRWRRHALLGLAGFGLGMIASGLPWQDTTAALAICGGYAMATLGASIAAVWRAQVPATGAHAWPAARLRLDPAAPR